MEIKSNKIKTVHFNGRQKSWGALRVSALEIRITLKKTKTKSLGRVKGKRTGNKDYSEDESLGVR